MTAERKQRVESLEGDDTFGTTKVASTGWLSSIYLQWRLLGIYKQLSEEVNQLRFTTSSKKVAEAVESLYIEFKRQRYLVAHHTSRVLKAYWNALGGCHLCGYGHDEAGGREAQNQALAENQGLICLWFIHSVFLTDCRLLAVVGAPYDTLEEVIGMRDCNGLGSLKDFEVTYRELSLAKDGGVNWDELACALRPQTVVMWVFMVLQFEHKEIEKALKMINASTLYMI
ncbi:uncharacterized protein [Aristolochia californica]|uniref:uncharacterized protein n=1 Tax=Aristolochia californica TaxID=171875 RepID=UPI0035E0317A